MPDEPLERLKQALQAESWRDVGFASFAEWVTAPPPRGLGTTAEQLWETAKRDPEATRLFDLQIPPLRPHGGTWPGAVFMRRINGDSHAYRVARLKRDRADLFASYSGGELSLIDAERQAGLRERTILVPVDPVRLAKSLRRRLSADALERLRELLNERR